MSNHRRMEKYTVTLSQKEREQLQAMLRKGSHASQKVLNALILLNCDEAVGGAGQQRSSQQIADVLHVSARKIDRVKRRFVEEGFALALGGGRYPENYERLVDGDLEAHLVALSCSEPPSGRARWTLKLLADKAVELNYVAAKRITLVMDNQNTNTAASLYEAFEPRQAKALWDRFEFVYTPKHGSWLNMAEIELNVMIGQCLDRRLDCIDKVSREVAAWQHQRDQLNAKVDWPFTCTDARIKLKRLYPTFDR